MSEKYGSAPKPANLCAKRPVFCFHCKRIYLSRALRPVCAKCGSSRVIDYSVVSGNIDALQNKGHVEEITKILQNQEVRQLKLERALELQKSSVEELSNKLKSHFTVAPKKVKQGEHPGPLNLNLGDEDKLWKRMHESSQKTQEGVNRAMSPGRKYPQTKAAAKQTNPGLLR